MCTGYEVDGEVFTEFPGDLAALDAARAAVRVDRGLAASDGRGAPLDDLPTQARRYLDRIEELAETPIAYVSVGTRRDQIIGL